MARSFSQLEKREQAVICIVLPLLAACAIGYFAWGELKKLGPDPALPKFIQRPGGVWQNIIDTEAQIEVQLAIADRKERVEKIIAGLQEEIRLAESILPREAEKTEMRKLIEDYARQIPPEIGTVQFRAVAIQEGGAVRGEDYQPITYQTEIRGDLDGIIKYIDQIEKNQRFMMVRGLTIKPGGLSLDLANQKVVPALHEVKMDIVTYVYSATDGAAPRRGR